MCGVQVVRKSIDVRIKRIESQIILVVNWFEIQAIWLSTDLRFKWVGCQWIWDSNGLVVNWCVIRLILFVEWFEIQVIRLSIDLRFKWYGRQSICKYNIVISIAKHKLPTSKHKTIFWISLYYKTKTEQALKIKNEHCCDTSIKLWISKTKFYYETSFKNQALESKNEACLRDFLQKSSFEDQKWRFF